MRKQEIPWVTEAELMRRRQEVGKWADTIVERFKQFGVEQDAQFFKIPVTRSGGEKEVHLLTKFSGDDPYKTEIKGLGLVPIGEVIEALVKVFPQMDRPALKGAIERLREEKKGENATAVKSGQ